MLPVSLKDATCIAANEHTIIFKQRLDSESGGMYSEWASLSSLIQNGNEDSQSVLGKFSSAAGKEVAVACG
ncbi:hypothetical protein L9F63_002891 [Diploptera punctata]|uniref:Uncharacterized protein n=1 Tax=Diploptera punctata TaxID=6984 RepID=A0AAD7ZRH0_DIPPU|nr:hypothetical protein L9F63_002891 [Diploptera punctata]